MAKGLVAPFKPVNFDKLPTVFREPDGRWFTIHSLTVAFVVNTKFVKNVPQSWADLLKPEYKNSIVYLDPRSTGVGQVMTFAANFGAGGDMNNVQPGLDYLGKLHKVRQRASRDRHHAVRTIRERRDSDLDLVRERRAQGEVHRWSRRCGCSRHPQGSVGGGTLRDQSRRKRTEPELGQAVAQLHHDRFRSGNICAGVRPAVGSWGQASRQCRRQIPSAPQVRPLDVRAAAAKKAEIDKGWVAATEAK